jgi:hypothetical protein
MTHEGVNRFAASVVLLFIVGALIVDNAPAPAQLVGCVANDEEREHIRAIALSAIDDGLKQHVVHLFDVWVKDSNDQPKRAIAGMSAGLRAYHNSRQNALKWNPPQC